MFKLFDRNLPTTNEDLNRAEVIDEEPKLTERPSVPPVPLVLATDTEAMKQKVFPPLDDLEPIADSHSTWAIKDWRALPERCNGPLFECGSFDWRLLLFPEGNQSESVSMYLEALPQQDSGKITAEKDAEKDSDSNKDAIITDTPQDKPDDDHDDDDWYVCAQFGLVMYNPRDPSIFQMSVAQHRFNNDESDWGFTKFYDLRRLFTRHADRESPLIENNQVCITAYVRVIKDPTGVLWHNFIKYNSKKETGFVGLKNQGATCYLNSLLQSLYFTKAFRNAVFHIPTENDRPDSVPLALQRLFYLLDKSDQPVGTLQLTRSFGWDSGDAFTQHDVQELNRVLMDNLEGKMKGTKVEGALNDIFVAQMKSYVRCVNVDFESSRSEDFWDIQLNVKGMKDLEASFKDYIQVEMLEGENQYQATGYGLQDAKKGVVFQSFPPVLHLQLKRYEYDFNRDMMVKINDRYEFPLEIDLSPFLEDGSDMSESWQYALHGVLVHSGDLNVGHYYALLKPSKEDKWYKFDDDRVTRATMKEVLEENFGGDSNTLPAAAVGGGQRLNRFNYKRHSSAYMLVYIRKTRLEQILPQSNCEIPSHIPRRIEQEELEEQARRKEREEQHFYMLVRTMSSRQFKKFHGFDIGPWDNIRSGSGSDSDDDLAQADYFRVRKTTTVDEFLKLYAEKYKIEDRSTLLLYTMVSRQNKTFRLDSPVVDLTQTVEYVREKGISKFSDLRFWVEDSTLNPPSPLIGQGSEKSLIFLKYFDPISQQISGIGTAWISSQDKVGQLAQVINQRMNWPSDTSLRLLEEIKPDMVDELKPKLAFAACEISDGDIICFERILDPRALETVDGYKTAWEFYDFLQHRINVTFEPRPVSVSGDERVSPVPEDHNDKSNGKFELWLSRKDTYDEMTEKVGHKLGVDPTHLQFFINGVSGSPRPIKRNGSNIQQLLAPPYVNQYSKVVMYDVLDMSLAEFESKKNVSVIWLTEGLSQEHKYDILVAKTAIMKDVIGILKEKANIPEQDISRIKMWGASNSRLHKMFTDNYPVISLVDSTQIYAAVSPEEEYDFVKSEVAPPDQRLIFALHFQKDPHRPHGIPFTFILRKGEKFADTKVRLQKVLGFYDKIFEKIKFAIVKTDGYAAPTYINDDDELFSLMSADESLGLDHYDKTVRKGYGQQAIFIKN